MSPRRLEPLRACLVCVFALVSAVRADDGATKEGVAYFEQHIRPLLAERCYACHSSREKKQKGGLLLDSRAGWALGGDQGPAVKPGDLDASLLIRAVRYTDPDLRMPPDRPLPKEAVARLERWVKMGAPDPRVGHEVEKESLHHPSDPIAGREHWAFRPLTNHRPPTANSSDWPRSPIDSFILEKLDAVHLRPAPEADCRTLLRRIHFQLIGLPPARKQVTAFLEDERPDAYERMVDQLLDSPQFGERWGRHWLDLARYADSNGLDENFLFREAWRYRNWVITAINADLPFDRFLTEQLAGDLLPFDSIEQRDRQRIAAGFLVIGPKVLLGNDPNQRRMDVADEQIDTVGRAVLGQTLGCARCHDHKFDPVPTTDYYALAGIFTSTQVMQRRYMLNEQRQMERLVGLHADGDELNAAYEKYWREHPSLKEREKQAKSALEFLERGEDDALKELAAKHADAVAAGAADTDLAQEQRVAVQKELLKTLQAELAAPPKIPPRAMIPCDVDKPADESVRLAGQFDRLGDQVPRGFLRVISDVPAVIPEGQSGRVELAHWLTDAENGAGQLAARVLANRVWHHLIGCGLVRTVDNFGRTGEAASHPELLDYLARRLIDSGWSIKDLVRQIVLSRTFAMSSHSNDTGDAIDPDNRLLWRAHRRRLEPEALRDAMLSAADQLDLVPRESTVSYLGDQATAVGDNKNRRRTDFPCRSVYLPVIRNDLPELFNVFDFANPHASTGMRPQTMVATQGLFMLNDGSVTAAADATARRMLAGDSPAAENDLVVALFELLFNTTPMADERAEILAFVRQIQNRITADGGKDADLQAWSQACQALFASSRFQILD
jgi:Protein of unknown function (DUF1549)/Protein of unknown function (DUF1553)/Planctomycete cytochrome C